MKDTKSNSNQEIVDRVQKLFDTSVRILSYHHKGCFCDSCKHHSERRGFYYRLLGHTGRCTTRIHSPGLNYLKIDRRNDNE